MTENDRPDVLAWRIAHGAYNGDAVMMHGAIVATLEHYPPRTAAELVFEPALTRLGGAGWRAARVAVNGQLAAYATAV